MDKYMSISVSDLIGASVHTREASTIIMEAIKNLPSSEIELDFSSVDYISRSFADQLYVDKIKIAEELQKSVVISNVNENVINMLQAVAKTQNRIQRNIASVPVYKFSSQEQLAHFLLSF